MKKSYCKVCINTEDDLLLKESLRFLTLTVNINLVLQANNKLYPQIYLDECFYELKILYKKIWEWEWEWEWKWKLEWE